MMAMDSLQGIFLDFYGTIASCDGQMVESVCQSVIDDHRLDVCASDLAARWGQLYFAAIESMNGGYFRSLAEIERDTLIETVMPLAGRLDVTAYISDFDHYLENPPLFAEAKEALRECRLPICIVSNADEQPLQSALAFNGLSPPGVVSSEAARCYKPDPGIFEFALKKMGWSAHRVLHVGDSLHSDIEGAHRAGLKGAWVRREGRVTDIGTEKPDFAWTDLRPIIAL